MSRSVNKVTILGHVGNAPEIRYTQNSTAVASFSVATSEAWKDKQTGEKKEQTEWHRCVAYRKTAEIIGEHVGKGSKIYIEGKLKTRKWQGQDGVERYTTEIIVSEVLMLDGKPQQQSQNSTQSHQSEPFNTGDDFDSDIPF